MCCPQCQGIENLFNQKVAEKELRDYRAHGPSETTRLLIEGLTASGVNGLTLLDIGGGVGAIQYGLLSAGVERATAVEASTAYIRAAREAAETRGLTGQVQYRQGDFVALAEEILPADIVTLDRVICCYPDMEGLVGKSSARARKLYGLVYPRNKWWIRVALQLLNLFYTLRKIPFRNFVHPTEAVEALLARQGFRRTYYRETSIWQIVVFAKQTT